MSRPAVTLVVRTYNSERTLAASLASVRSQTVEARVVVVDSGSQDGTLAIARDLGDEVVEMPHSDFSYGRALNVGAAAATTGRLGALSSHTVLPHEEWLAVGLAHLDVGAVAACGGLHDAEHRPLDAPFRADDAYFREHRYWGFTNTANVFDTETWRREPFDETLVATEDQEWSWRAVRRGGYVVVDPRLVVSGGHRRNAGVRDYHRRMVSEIRALEHVRPLQRYRLLDAAGDWVRDEPVDPFISRARRFGRTRLLDVAARWEAGVQSSRGRTPQPRITSLSGGGHAS